MLEKETLSSLARMLHSRIVEHELPEELIELSNQLIEKSIEFEGRPEGYNAFLVVFERFTESFREFVLNNRFFVSLAQNTVITILIKMLEKFIKP